MTKVSVSRDRLVVEMLGWDKLWALKGQVTVPLVHVISARAADGERVYGWRLPGTYVPGLIAAGTYWHDGQRDFWSVHDDRQVICIDLRGEFFSRLIVQVPDPTATVEAIQRAITAVKI